MPGNMTQVPNLLSGIRPCSLHFLSCQFNHTGAGVEMGGLVSVFIRQVDRVTSHNEPHDDVSGSR